MNEAGKPSFCTKVQFSLTSDPQVLALQQEKLHANSQCLKITEKVAFSIASEASYVYILSGQKLIKIAKNGQFWRLFENLKLAVKQCYQTGHFKKHKN